MKTLMRRAGWIFVFQALALIGGACAQDPANSNENPEQHLFRRLNQARQNAGLPALQWDNQLAQAALTHAQTMAERNSLSHQVAGEPRLLRRVAVTGARFTSAAENIACVEVADDAHVSWMLSPGHRANMMSPEYNRVGIGVVRRKGVLYVTQDFARMLPVYTQDTFRDALIAALNRFRESKGLRSLAFVPDAKLRAATCSSEGDVQQVAAIFSGSSLRIAVFTLSDPANLPQQAEQEILHAWGRDARLEVCYRPDDQHGYANFWASLVSQN